MGPPLLPAELSRHSWPPGSRTQQLPLYQSGPFTGWVAASGRWRCRSSRCDPVRVFKARCRTGGTPPMEESGGLDPQRSHAQPLSGRRLRPWQVHSPCAEDGEFESQRLRGARPLSRRSRPPGRFILHCAANLDDSGCRRGPLLIVLCWFSAVVAGWRVAVLPDMLGAAPAPTAPGRPPFRVAGTGVAGQAGAGRAHSRRQQDRKVSFQGQVRLIFSVRARAWRTSRAGRLSSR